MNLKTFFLLLFATLNLRAEYLVLPLAAQVLTQEELVACRGIIRDQSFISSLRYDSDGNLLPLPFHTDARQEGIKINLVMQQHGIAAHAIYLPDSLYALLCCHWIHTLHQEATILSPIGSSTNESTMLLNQFAHLAKHLSNVVPTDQGFNISMKSEAIEIEAKLNSFIQNLLTQYAIEPSNHSWIIPFMQRFDQDHQWIYGTFEQLTNGKNSRSPFTLRNSHLEHMITIEVQAHYANQIILIRAENPSYKQLLNILPANYSSSYSASFFAGILEDGDHEIGACFLTRALGNYNQHRLFLANIVRIPRCDYVARFCKNLYIPSHTNLENLCASGEYFHPRTRICSPEKAMGLEQKTESFIDIYDVLGFESPDEDDGIAAYRFFAEKTDSVEELNLLEQEFFSLHRLDHLFTRLHQERTSILE